MINIGGFVKQTLIDYPGNISSMIFTRGCNFRCPYCHNPHLVIPELFEKTEISTTTVFNFLHKNQNLIDALIISGGEPTLHKHLVEFIIEVKVKGLKVKLDTNGTKPLMLKKLFELKLIDFVAMDIKTELDYEKYNEISGNCLSKTLFENVLHSVDIIRDSGIGHEFRTTALEQYHTNEIINNIKKYLKEDANYTINQFRPAEKMISLIKGNL